jgi:uncharacterized protein YfiM (DUF2279 family)
VRIPLTFILLFSLSLSAFSFVEKDSSTINKKRLNTVIATQILLSGTSFLVLNELWYKNFHQSKFHFFDDNKEWLQIDKIGHLYTAYHLTGYGSSIYRWSGLENNKSILLTGVTSFSYLLGIEILDGFSAKWGFSWGDIVANTCGVSIAIGQNLLGFEDYFTLKFSFSQSGYAPLRPNLLGNTFAEQILKDYNGQSYWLSLSPSSIFKINKSWFPQWLNLAIGYSGDGMIAARNGQIVEINLGNSIYYFKTQHMRQFYLSLDIDLRKIPVKNSFLKNAFYAINILKIPAPALEINKYDSRFHYLYF